MRISLLLALVLLAGCESGQPVPTATENQQLDDAANMLDSAEQNLAKVDARQLPAEPDTNRD